MYRFCQYGGSWVVGGGRSFNNFRVRVSFRAEERRLVDKVKTFGGIIVAATTSCVVLGAIYQTRTVRSRGKASRPPGQVRGIPMIPQRKVVV